MKIRTLDFDNSCEKLKYLFNELHKDLTFKT